MKQTSQIAAIILTKDEEGDLPACLESLQCLGAEIHVVDSGSRDRTLEIAAAAGARVWHHDFLNHAAQFNWALDNIQTEAEWILRIDADERISPALAKSLQRLLPTIDSSVAGILMPRAIFFLGRLLRWGDTYPVWLLRLFRRHYGRCEETWMDEHIILSGGKTIRVDGDLIHDIPKSLAEWSRKHVWYAERECKDILGRSSKDLSHLDGQARMRRFVKQRLYFRLPALFRASVYWFYRYFLKLGFVDGKAGFIYHMLQAFWYRFLIDAMLFELSLRKGQHSEAALINESEAPRSLTSP
jgi:glycosyltransferase involved in cell wall biosynthesis